MQIHRVSGQLPEAFDEGAVRSCPCDFVTVDAARNLECDVAGVPNGTHRREERREIDRTGAERHRAAAIFPILDVDAPNARTVGRELIFDPKAE
jgi:hypothetical protein